MSTRVKVFCKACARVVSSFQRFGGQYGGGTESWRSCSACHQRGTLITIERAREDGLIQAAEIDAAPRAVTGTHDSKGLR